MALYILFLPPGEPWQHFLLFCSRPVSLWNPGELFLCTIPRVDRRPSNQSSDHNVDTALKVPSSEWDLVGSVNVLMNVNDHGWNCSMLSCHQWPRRWRVYASRHELWSVQTLLWAFCAAWWERRPVKRGNLSSHVIDQISCLSYLLQWIWWLTPFTFRPCQCGAGTLFG